MVINNSVCCPRCNSSLKLADKDVNSLFKTAVCLCSKYPVVDGIILLDHSTAQFKIGSYKRIVNLLSFSFAAKVFFGLTFLFRDLYKYLGFANFITLLTFLGFPRNWSNYLKRRTKIPSFFMGLLTLALIKNGQRVLDLGCGTGNMLPFYYNHTLPENVILSDSSFLSLFIARHFFAKPETTLICTDLNQRLPIKKTGVELIYIIDSFHYFKKKQHVLAEISRIMKKNGHLAIVHSLNTNTPKDNYALPQKPEFIINYLEKLGLKYNFAISNKKFWREINKNNQIKLETDNNFKKAYAFNIISSQVKPHLHLKLNKSYSKLLKRIRVNYYQDLDLKKP